MCVMAEVVCVGDRGMHYTVYTVKPGANASTQPLGCPCPDMQALQQAVLGSLLFSKGHTGGAEGDIQPHFCGIRVGANRGAPRSSATTDGRMQPHTGRVN